MIGYEAIILVIISPDIEMPTYIVLRQLFISDEQLISSKFNTKSGRHC